MSASTPRPAPAWLVTGTDTGVGKSMVGAALVRAWCDAGVDVGVLKPVESGVADAPADGTLLWDAAGRRQPLEEVCPVRLRAPLAPPVAARQEGVVLDPGDWARRIDALRARHARVLVEGAGGLLSPLWEGGHAAELARRCGLAVLVVAPDRLGVINHVRLTVEALQRRELAVVAVVLSRVAPGAPDPSCATNAAEIARVVAPPVVGPLPHVDDPTPAALADALRGCAGAERLLPPFNA